MTVDDLSDLRKRELITQEQFNTIEPILSRKAVSLFYELRTLLYLGVMLFSTGIGILIYQNIGDIGHVIAIISLSLLALVSITYCFLKGKPFSTQKVEPPVQYFDYLLLLGCLLVVSVFGYLEFQYGFLEKHGRMSSLITSAFFFFIAYRFDHLGILSLAITSLAGFFGIVVTFNDLSSFDKLFNVGLGFSLTISGVAFLLELRKIKEHFTFTYLNFCALIFFCSALAGLFDYDRATSIYLLLLFVGVGLSVWLSRKRGWFIFLLYSFIAGYIGFTYAISEAIDWDEGFWFFYMIASCGALIFLIVRFRKHLKHKE